MAVLCLAIALALFVAASQQIDSHDLSTSAAGVLPLSENTTSGQFILLQNVNRSSSDVLSRRKRYVVFPKGSSIQFIYCATFHEYVPLTKIFTLGLTIGLAWQLPTETRQLYLQRRDTHQNPDREHRLRFYNNLDAFLTTRGMFGRQCIMRTLCESSERNQKGSFMEELLRVIFTLPLRDRDSSLHWDEARHNGTTCAQRFPLCSSIVDFPLNPHDHKK